jgi:hypothetical protein
MDFQYTTGFTSQLTASALDKDQFDISKASLEPLKEFIPKDVDLERNIDLLGVAFNGAVVNLFNKNGDGIESSMAVAIKDYFIHKPTNIEHNKKRVVGHIVRAGFTTFGENNIMSEEEALEEFGPFNLALGAVVYKTVDASFAEMVESSVDPESDLYQAVSASWEIGFNDYYIALGSPNLKEAEVVTDKPKIKELSQYLKANDGEGMLEDGTPVYRLVVGDIYPLGIGFTSNPAAKVKGVVTADSKKKASESVAEEEVEKIEFDSKIEIMPDVFLENYRKNENNISQTDKRTVINNNNEFDMETKNLINDIRDMLEAQASEQYSEEAVANIAKVVGDVIKEKSEQYEQEKQAALEEKAQAEEREEATQTQFTELQEKLAETEQKLEEVTKTQEEQASQQRFDLRMGTVDEAYELSDEDREILAKEVIQLDQADESFASYQEKLSVMWSHKNKDQIAEQEKAFQEKVEAEVAKRVGDKEAQASDATAEDQADDERSDEEVLDKVEKVETDITNNNGESSSEEESLREQFLKTFTRENVTINY